MPTAGTGLLPLFIGVTDRQVCDFVAAIDDVCLSVFITVAKNQMGQK